MLDRPVTRRTTVAVALGTPLALGACDVDAPTPGAAAAPRVEPDADASLVSEVIGALVASRAVLEAAAASVPSLTPRLQPVAEAHGQHLDRLLGATPEATETTPAIADPPTLKPGRRVALRAVRDAEQTLLRHARRACLAAASGDLARALASIAASTAQHTAALTGAAAGEATEDGDAPGSEAPQ